MTAKTQLNMKPPLQKLFDFAADAASSLFKRQGYLIPMWVGINKKGTHVPLIVRDMDDKDRVVQVVKEFLKREGITQYASMLECWIYEGEEVPPEILEGKSLEHNPDRREAIHILAEDTDGNSLSGHFYILRPEHGKPTLTPLKMLSADGKTEGRFIGLLD